MKMKSAIHKEPCVLRILLMLSVMIMVAPCVAQNRYDVVAVRSNLLFPLLNVGMEVPIGNRWSVSADFYYPWVFRPWMDSVTGQEHKTCIQTLGGYVDGRYWFGDRHAKGLMNVDERLIGHSIGVFGCGGYYDYEMNWEGRQGEYYGGGISYMYAFPLGRNRGLHLELELGVGFYYVEYRPYTVYDNSPHLIAWGTVVTGTGLLPLKAAVNLTVPLQNKSKKRIVFGR